MKFNELRELVPIKKFDFDIVVKFGDINFRIKSIEIDNEDNTIIVKVKEEK